MARQRASTARLAVLGSSIQRSAPGAYTSRSGTALRRRIVVGVLVVLSLALLTIYFREPSGGGLHRIQSGGSTILRPFEVGVERVARPFRDVYGYFHGLFTAKSEVGRLRSEVEQLRQAYIQNESALQENVHLRALLRYEDTATFPKDFRLVNARVISRPPGQFEQQVVISAGSNRGISEHDPVVTDEGLIGEVTKVASTTAQVTLLTDDTIAVAAEDVTGAFGLIRHGAARGQSLILDRVTKDQVVHEGDVVITAGMLSPRLRSLYPRGIPIGTVKSVGRTDTDPWMQIQVDPYVDFSSLDGVAVLFSTKPKPKLP